MSQLDLIPIVLLILFVLAVGFGTVMVMLALRWRRQEQESPRQPAAEAFEPQLEFPRLKRSGDSPLAHRPTAWLAIRSRNPRTIQNALALNNPSRCSWKEGLAGGRGVFIAPPVNGWILVFGAGLPNPDDDVDACFRFLMGLSREVGQVQFFNADRVLHHHAWARIEASRVVRAYAWAGKVLWNQGAKTAAEIELGLKCFTYGESPTLSTWSLGDLVAANVERVPALASRWSIDLTAMDPHWLERAPGIAGRPSRFY